MPGRAPVAAGREERAGVPQQGPLLHGPPRRLPREGVSSFDVFLKEVTGGVRRPSERFGTSTPADRAHLEARPDPGRQLRGRGQEAFKKLKWVRLSPPPIVSGVAKVERSNPHLGGLRAMWLCELVASKLRCSYYRLKAWLEKKAHREQ